MSSRPTAEVRQMAQDFAQDTVSAGQPLPSRKPLPDVGHGIATRVAISELRRARWRNVSLDLLTADGDLMPAFWN